MAIGLQILSGLLLGAKCVGLIYWLTLSLHTLFLFSKYTNR